MLNIHRHTDTEIAAGVLHLATMPDYPRRPRVGVILAIDDYGNVEMARTPFTMRSSWEKRHAEHIIGFYTASAPARYIAEDLAHLRRQRAQQQAVVRGHAGARTRKVRA